MSTGISNNFVSLKGLSSFSFNTGNTLLSRIEPCNWYGSIARKISSLTSSMREAVVSGACSRTGLIAGVVVCGVTGAAVFRRWFVQNENVNDNNACEYVHRNLDLESRGSENKHNVSSLREAYEEDCKRIYEPVTGEVDLGGERMLSYINKLYFEVVKVEKGLAELRGGNLLRLPELKSDLEEMNSVDSIRATLKKYRDNPTLNEYPIIKIGVDRPETIERILGREDFLKEVKKIESRINKYREQFVNEYGKNVLDTNKRYSQLAEMELEEEKKSRR